MDKYQVTSDAQREAMSNIIAHETKSTVEEKPQNAFVIEAQSAEKVNSVEVKTQGSDKAVSVSSANVCDIITNVLECSSKCGKSRVKIQIEVINE